MPKNPNQKLKLLYLARILEEESDEAHPMAMSDLLTALSRAGVSAERKSVYDDIEALGQFGYDVVKVRGRGNTYYLGARPFEAPELKLLVDAVQSAKFISESKSRALIKKICGLASRHEGRLMQRQVHVQGRTKTQSERTYYNVDSIQSAIADNWQITFKYYEWAVEPRAVKRFTRRWRHEGKPYQISPWTLLWDDENYYLLGYDSGAGIIKHYRVDKMTDIALVEAEREGRTLFEALDMATYTKSVFGMFGGQEQAVTLCFANHLVGVVVDRFGGDIHIVPNDDGTFKTTLRAVISPQFISWVFGFGDEVRLLSPPGVVQAFERELEAVRALYKMGQ